MTDAVDESSIITVRTVVVVGATGFIGRHLVARLLGSGLHVIPAGRQF